MDDIKKIELARTYFESIAPITEVHGPYGPSKSDRFYPFSIRAFTDMLLDYPIMYLSIEQLFRETPSILVRELPNTPKEIERFCQNRIDVSAIRMLNWMKHEADYYLELINK